ncbi:MAG: PLAT/LH2 domain-containing protein [Pseudothermotoga sp.]
MRATTLFLRMIFISLLASSVLSQTRIAASSFSSNGDFINGWYWLRDSSYQHIAEWVFEGIPSGEGNIVLDLEVLATDRAGGPRGVDARFYLSWGIPPSDGQGGLVLGTQEVFLPNVSPASDPVGYTCRGQVIIPRTNLENASKIWIRVHRSYVPGQRGTSPSLVHVAFRKESATLLVNGSSTTSATIRDADWRWEAETIEPGTHNNSLGQRTDGSLDEMDWYRIFVSSGQIIRLTLTIPQNANFSISLYPPNSDSIVGSVSATGNTRTLEYVAAETGDWFIRVRRASGYGEYTLNITLSDQNDAQSGKDAGNFRWDALSISQGTWTGFLKAADDNDWYRVVVSSGQTIRLGLTMPQNARFSLYLYPPNSDDSVGTASTTGNARSLEYTATQSGNWYIRVNRASGEGEYSLKVETGEDTTVSPPPPPDLTPPSFAGYRIIVTTGDVSGAGTDANVYITIYGEIAATEEIFLDDPGRNDFERYQVDTFELLPGQVQNVAAPVRIQLRHDNSGTFPGWYVVSVVIVDIATGQEYLFILDRWLATDEGDGSISVVKERVGTSKQTFTAPYAAKREWTHTVGEAVSRARANESTGGIAFYTDSWIGGSTATAGQSIWVNTPSPVDLIVNAVVKYVGGTVNFGFASFSELEIFWEVNDEYHSKKLSPAFSGPVVIDKIISLALLAAGGLLAEGTAFGADRVAKGLMAAETLDKLRKAQQIVEIIGLVYSLQQLNTAFHQLEEAGDLKTEHLNFTCRTKPGWNKISIGLRGNTSSVVTGSSFTIIGGVVESIEVQGLP